MHKYFISLLIITLLSLESQAQLQVKRISSASDLTETGGLVYALPRALICIDVDMEINHHYKGPYAIFAEELLGLKDYIINDYNTYEIIGFKINTVAVPDPQQIFYASWNAKESRDERSLSLSLSDKGLIKAAGILNSAAELRIKEDDITNKNQIPELFEFYYGPNRVKKVDTIIRIVHVDTNTFRKEFFNTRFELRPEKEKAMDAADYISQLRQNRQNLLSGYQEVPYPAQSVRYMNEELKRLTDEYVSLFRGLKTTERTTQRFYVLPSENEESQLISIFKFSEENGISPANSNTGRDVYISFRKEGHGALLETFQTEGKSGIKGFFYRTPENVFTEIKYYGKTRKEAYLSIPQFGKTQQLPADLKYIEFNEKTGGIRKLSW